MILFAKYLSIFMSTVEWMDAVHGAGGTFGHPVALTDRVVPL